MKSKPSLSMRLVELVLKIPGNSFNAAGFLKLLPKLENRPYPSPAPIPGNFRRFVNIQEYELEDRQVFTISPIQDQQPIHIIYTHGGAYTLPLVIIHWFIIQELIKQLGATVTVPIYPLAPEFTYRDAFPFLKNVYQHVLGDYPAYKMVLCGDSAGGGLALAQAMHYRDLGLPMPHHLVLFSPWLDITLANPEATTIEPQDTLLGVPGLVQCGLWWAGGDDPRSALLSPIYGDLAGLPSIELFIGTKELLLPDARKLKSQAVETGIDLNLYEVPGAFHVFVAATFTPEAKHVFSQLKKVLP